MPGLWSSLRTLFGGKPADEPMRPDVFTDALADRLRACLPNVDVRVVGELELAISIEGNGNGDNRAYLTNAYQVYLGESSQERDEVIDRFVHAFAEAAKGLERSSDAIIPVVKDRVWLANVRESMRRMDKQDQEFVYEDINEALIAVYAIDTPSNIAYLNADELLALGVEREQLRALAVRNLRGLLPRIEVKRGDKLSMVIAGGNYEASLLLFSDLWARESERMRGAPVAAVPARDVLIFADSADSEAVAQLRQLATKAQAEATYALTDRLLALREDRWELF